MADNASLLESSPINRAPSALRGDRLRPISVTRRNLRAMMSDGLSCSVMIGLCENYLPAFALALGMSQVTAGLIPGVPLLAGAVLQLAAPLAIRRIGSQRRWVVLTVTLQALCLAPLMITALVGHIWTPLFFLLATFYWGAGMASAPAWNAWVETLVPPPLRVRFFGCFARMAQCGLLAGFVGGGLLLALGQHFGWPLRAFAALYLAAAVARFVSSRFLASQSEPDPLPAETNRGGIGPLIRRLRTAGDGRLLVCLWTMQFTTQIAVPFFTPFMLGHLGFSYLRFMLIASMALAVKALALPRLSRVIERFGARRLLAFCAVVIAPLPTLWIISQATPWLLFVQILSGLAWGLFELSSMLAIFETIERRRRVGMLTLHGLGSAVATVGGSVCGAALLATWGEGRTAYCVVFGVSSVARLLSAAALRTVGQPQAVAEIEASGEVDVAPAFILAPVVIDATEIEQPAVGSEKLAA